jgi:hypothetical protein
MSDTSSATPTSQTFFQWLTGELDAGWNFLKNLFKTTVSSEVAALAPFAEQAVSTAVSDIGVLFSGGLKAFATAVAPVLVSTAEAAEAAGVSAAGSSLISAVGGALANAQANAQSSASPQPPAAS